MADMTEIMVGPIRLRDLGKLRRQFEVAANSSFSYLEPRYRSQVIKDNNLPRLIVAWVRPDRLLLAAMKDGVLLGYIIGSVERPSANIYWLYVDPASRGQNVGLRLLAAFRRHAEKLGARNLVLATYDHQPYYARQGFKTVDKKTLHGKPMDIMALRIASNE